MRLSTFRRWLTAGWVWGLTPLAAISTLHATETIARDAVQSAMGGFAEFQSVPANWSVAGGVAGDLRRGDQIQTQPGSGVWINRPDEHAHGDLITAWTHDDLIVAFDYLLPAGSSAAMSFQGRYELKLPDQRAPGLWQHARAEFQAARFDANGQQVAPARLVSLKINGVVIHEHSELTQPNVAGVADPGPFIIHGNHGAFALRRFAVQPLVADQVALQNLHYTVYQGEFAALDDYRHTKPTLTGATKEINETLANTTDAFAMVVTGEFAIPKAGWYRFNQTTDAISQTRLLIDGQTPIRVGASGEESQIRLAAGTHPFRLDYLRPGKRGKPLLAWSVTGPDMRSQPLSFSAAHPPDPIPVVPVVIEPGRVHTHRCFFPYADSKRLYVAAVGTQQHVNYAYDLAWQSLLAVWCGGYLDASGIWHERGIEQIVRPIGASVELGAGPALAVLKTATDAWPDPEAAARAAAGDNFDPDDNQNGPPTAIINPPSDLASRGYTLAPDGQPAFQFTLHDIAVEDRWSVDPDNRGLVRTLTFSKPLARDDVYLLLAKENRITAESGYFLLGDRKAYLDWPTDQPVSPQIQTDGANLELRAHLPVGTTTITYRLIW